MRHVAIVDDMLPNALLLKSYMRQIEGIESATFTDPDEALAFYRDALGLEVRMDVASDGFRYAALPDTDWVPPAPAAEGEGEGETP